MLHKNILSYTDSNRQEMKIFLLTILSVAFANLCASQKLISPLESKKLFLNVFDYMYETASTI